MSKRKQDFTSQDTLSLRGELLKDLRLIFTTKDREYLDKFESLSEKEKQECEEFIEFYSYCPNCHKQNPKYNLIGIFLDDSEEKQEIREKLVSLMKKQKKKEGASLSVGVLCCECYEHLFNKKVHE